MRLIPADANQLHTGERVLHVALLIGLVVLAYLAITDVPTVAVVNKSLRQDTLNPWYGIGLAACAGGGFVAGRVIGIFRSNIRKGLNGQVANPLSAGLSLEIGVAIFLATAAILLAYETWALANGGNPPAITSYVRFAAYHHPVLSGVMTTTIAAMLSNWLWYPTK